MANTAEGLSSSPPAHRIAGLDGLRALSILLVLLGHGWATFPAAAAPLAGLAPYLGNAWLGVMTFFVLSGFLITHLLRKEWEKIGTIQLRAFYARRVLRIFPALYAYLLVLVLLRLLGAVDTTWGQLAVAGTFLTNYGHVLPVVGNEDYWFVGHFWTLSLEEQFYLLWPASILAVGLLQAPRVALALVLLSPPVRVITYHAWPDSRGQLVMMLHTAADPLMIGCLMALWQGKASFERLLRTCSSWPWPMGAALFLLVGSPFLAARFRGAYLMTVGLSLNGLAVAFLMLWVVRHPTSAAGRLLCTPALRHVGILSYSLYLWQQLFLTTRNHTWTGAFPLNFLMCFAAAELSYWVIERPFLWLRDRWRQDAVAGSPGRMAELSIPLNAVTDGPAPRGADVPRPETAGAPK